MKLTGQSPKQLNVNLGKINNLKTFLAKTTGQELQGSNWLGSVEGKRNFPVFDLPSRR